MDYNFKNAIVILEIRTLRFVKNESLGHTVKFVIGSAVSKEASKAVSKSWPRILDNSTL